MGIILVFSFYHSPILCYIPFYLTLCSTNDAIDNFLTTLRNDNADDIIRGAATANNLVASLANQNLDDMDLSDLLGTADSLSALLRYSFIVILIISPNFSED